MAARAPFVHQVERGGPFCQARVQHTLKVLLGVYWVGGEVLHKHAKVRVLANAERGLDWMHKAAQNTEVVVKFVVTKQKTTNCSGNTNSNPNPNPNPTASTNCPQHSKLTQNDPPNYNE